MQNKTSDTRGTLAGSSRQALLLTAVCLVLILSVVFTPGCGREAPPASTPQTSAAALAASPTPAPAPVPTVEAWAAVSGQGGTITLPDGSKKAVAAEAATVPAGSRVELANASSAVRLAYDGEGTIDVTGRGIVQSRPDGFETKDAAFKASFKRGKRGFSVRVPGAVLGVRGTVIGFNLADGAGTVQLVEGNVVVQPEQPGAAEFEWKPGQLLAMTAGKIDKVIPAGEKPTEVKEPDPKSGTDKPVVQPQTGVGDENVPTPKSPFENQPDAVHQQPDTMSGDGGDGFGGN